MFDDTTINYIKKIVPSITKQMLVQLQDYLNLLLKWNQAYNLIGPTTEKEIITKHLFDCLSIHSFIQGQRILDVGTGAGLPGLLLAIIYPNKQWTLVDSNGKKTRFLIQTKHALQLANVEVLQVRVEAIIPKEKYDIIVSRAFADINKMVKLTQHLLQPEGRFLAMKGKYDEPALEPWLKDYKITAHELNVPLLVGQRHLVILEGKIRE